jgi:hypothetical protein
VAELPGLPGQRLGAYSPDEIVEQWLDGLLDTGIAPGNPSGGLLVAHHTDS